MSLWWWLSGPGRERARRMRLLTGQDPLILTPGQVEALREQEAELKRQRQYDRLYTYEDIHGDDR